MIGGRELLEAYDAAPTTDALASTGISELDELTGGPQAGHVWVLTGDVGEGKTTLLTQLAVAVAAGGHPAQLVCPCEPSSETARRLLSHLGRLPARSRPSGASATEFERIRVAQARRTLEALPITVFAGDTATFTPETHPYSDPPVEAVFVDDADLVGGMGPSRASRYADEGRLVVVSLPRDQVLQRPSDSSALAQEWGRVSDVVIEVRTRDVSEVWDSETGELRGPDFRPGEGDLLLHRNRNGPTSRLRVAAQFHYARFRGFAAGARV